jgi:hypothetical protein
VPQTTTSPPPLSITVRLDYDGRIVETAVEVADPHSELQLEVAMRAAGHSATLAMTSILNLLR